MYLLPYDSFQIDSPLPLDESVDLLKSKVEQHKIRHVFNSTNAEFHGKVNREGFKISRNIRRRNSFRPLVTGKFLPTNNGTVIQIQMGLPPGTLLFVLIWLGGVGFFTFQSLFSSGFNSMSTPSWLIPVGMFIFGVALTLGGFWYEAIQQKKWFFELSEGQKHNFLDSN